MDNIIYMVIAGVVGLIVGYIIAKVLERNSASATLTSAKKTADRMLKDAKSEGDTIKKDKILQAKEKFIELKSEHEKVIYQKPAELACRIAHRGFLES